MRRDEMQQLGAAARWEFQERGRSKGECGHLEQIAPGIADHSRKLGRRSR